MSRAPRSLFDEILELAVYVPVGLATKALEQVPGLAEAGRARVGPQLDQARVIGRFAVGLARSKAGRSLGAAARAGPRTPERRREPEPPGEREQNGRSGAEEAARAPRGSTAERPTSEAGPEPHERPSPPQAIPDYDALSASQVVPRLSGLDREELEAVGRYEAATRKRRTILNRVAQLERAFDER